jgi:hypothetical protein
MMTIVRPLAAALLLSVCAAAQERAPELPGLDQVRDALPAQAAEPSPVPAAATGGADCPAPDLSVALLTPPWFHSGWGVRESISAHGREAGTLEADYPGSRAMLSDASGAVIASARAEDSGALRTLSVSDCRGVPIGAVLDRSAGRDEEFFEVRDAQGRLLASAGPVRYDEGGFALADAAGRTAARVAADHSFRSRTTVDAGSLDPRLALMAAALKKYADARHFDRESRRGHGGR